MITQDELKSTLHYCPETGVFTWLKATGKKVKIGKIAGHLTVLGYITIRINKKNYMAHRLAWLYVYGYIPEKHTDHINGVTTDNSIKNLREASASENLKNRGAQKNNTSGFKGVTFDKNNNKWMAQCTVNRRCIFLGRYLTPYLASEAYKSFAMATSGEFYPSKLKKDAVIS